MAVLFAGLSFFLGSAPLFRDFSNSKSNGRTSASPFVMRVLEDEMVSTDDDEDEEVNDRNFVGAKRFNFDDLYLRCAIKLPICILSYNANI